MRRLAAALPALAMATLGFAGERAATRADAAGERIRAPRPERVRVVRPADLTPNPEREPDGPVVEIPNALRQPVGGGSSAQAPLPVGDARLIQVRDAGVDGTDGVPSIDINFAGLDDDFTIPDDPDIAVGANHVVCVINNDIGMYDKTGTLVDGPYTLKAFFGIPAGFDDFDPLAIYDPWSDRYIVSTIADNDATTDSRIYVAFSETNDATGNWNTYWIDADLNDAGRWADYHSVGIDSQAVYFTANMIPRASGSTTVTLFVYDKEDGYAGNPLDNTHLIDIRTAANTVPFTTRPAYVDEAVAGGEFYLAHADNAIGDRINVFRLTGDRFNNPSLSAEAVVLPELFFGAIWARQPNAPPNDERIDTLGGRLFNVVYRNGRIWTAHALDGVDVLARVYRVDVSVNPAVREQTYELTAAGEDVYFPYVFPDSEDNDFALATAVSGPTTWITNRYWNIDAAGTVRHSEDLGTGDSPNNTGRHGDYFSIDPDGVNTDRIWMIGTSYIGGDVQRIASALFENASGGPPPIPDGASVAGAQLQVSKTATPGEVTITWGDAGCDPPDNHLVWFDLAGIDTYTVDSTTCDIGSTPRNWTGLAPSADVAVIVVPDDDASVEGSHGFDSGGGERPSATPAAACGITSKDVGGSCP